MNKHIMNVILATALIVPSLVCAFEHKQDGITLKVTDYAQETTSVLGYTPDGALTADAFLTKGIHPIRITLKNDTNKPIMVSGRSIRLKTINQEECVPLLHEHNLAGIPAWGHKLGSYALGTLIGFYTINWGFGSFDVPYITDQNNKMSIISLVGLICLSRCSSNLANKEEALTKLFKDLAAQEELRYPEVIQPGKKITKLLLIDERTNKKRMVDFLVFDEKHEETITKFEINLA